MIFPLKQKKLIRGAEGHLKAGLGIAADYEADYASLYAPCDGKIETWQGEQGGNWLRIIRPDGKKIEFAHLDQYSKLFGSCQEGDLIAVTGNTGQVTTGPHLHIQIFETDGQRIDPEKYFEGFEPKLDEEETTKEKIKNNIRQDDAFSLLVIVDDELWRTDVDTLILETQRGIWQDSREKLTLVPYVSYHKLPVWDNSAVEKIAKENFDLKTFQGVAVVYKVGKFREAFGQMNPFYKDLGFLINVSYEDPDGDGPYKTATVLEHELLHAFLYLLGVEYVECVHESPNEFSDDFEKTGRTIEKLYYRRDPEPKVEDSGKNNVAEESKKYSLNATDLKKIGVGALVALGGAALVYFADVLVKLDFGVWTPLVVAFSGILVNAIRKYLAGLNQ